MFKLLGVQHAKKADEDADTQLAPKTYFRLALRAHAAVNNATKL